ncbi:polycomb protein Scm-like isoform X1 [Clytia hemisphaerica]|uniref:HMG box domain-containing protein n=3 Tax=Clytia hemisphaerica TaxID=252671 RepID=A0A7M5XBI3_9CNID
MADSTTKNDLTEHREELLEASETRDTIEESHSGEETDRDRPINSYASMIYFKEKPSKHYSIKEEPSSPEDEWKPLDDAAAKSKESKKNIQKPDEMPNTAIVNPLRSMSSSGSPLSYTTNTESVSRTQSKATHTPKSPSTTGLPQKPLTPYMSYRNMIFEEIKHKYPGCSPYDLACLISSKWSMLTDSERKVWEDQYEVEMRKYNERIVVKLPLPKSNATKIDWNTESATESSTSPTQIAKTGIVASTSTTASNTTTDENKSSPQVGNCKLCQRCTTLQDFSSVIDGHEIYCSGLCSEKCYMEAAKQIHNFESGSTSKGRYGRSSTSQESSSASSHLSTSSTSSYSNTTNNAPDLIRHSKSSSLFDWEQYLSVDPQSSIAHWMFFRQARSPHVNSFVAGMKLEACSYNASNMSPTFSLATVIATVGSRILLHFDGADPSSDIWRLPDSGDIHPVGWTEGSLLKAPMGYKYDPSKYNKYFATSLQSAEIAPARFFKKEPKKPMENYFTVGMKMEAVDKSKPSYIGVATVVDVEGEQIKIAFDGYKELGYWCHYYDRDLFPAGWCARSGHPLRPPSNKVNPIYQRESRSSPPPSMASIGPKSPLIQPTLLPSQSQPQAPQPPQSRDQARDHATSSSTSSWKDKSASPNSVEVFLNLECYCGPYIELNKLKSMQRIYNGNMVTVLKNVLEDVIRCAIDPKTVFGFLKPGRGNCVIKAICDGVTYQCCLNSIDRVSTFWRVLEQFSDNLRCCPNIFSSTESRLPCTRCNNNRVRSLSSVHEYHRAIQSHSRKAYGTHSSYSSHSNRNDSYSRSESTSRTEHSPNISYSMSSYDFGGRRDSECDSPNATSNSRKDSVFEPPLLTTVQKPINESSHTEKHETLSSVKRQGTDSYFCGID